MQDMIQCHNLSVLERQRAQLQWQQHTQDSNNFFVDNLFSFHGECLGDGWPIIATNNKAVSAAAATSTTTASNSTPSLKFAQENSSSKKRKADMHPVVTGNEDEGNTTEDSRESSSKDKNNNNGKKKKPDYVHVRARRGQATNSHSLAERARREKISERMKYLQALVPGCDRITGKAGMLDEIINYVQSLQKQVEFLSMKLATVKPTLDLNMDALLSKEVAAGIEISDATFTHAAAAMKFSSNHNMSANDPSLMLNHSQLQQAIAMPEQSVRRISAGSDNKLDSFYSGVGLCQGRVFPQYPVLCKGTSWKL